MPRHAALVGPATEFQKETLMAKQLLLLFLLCALVFSTACPKKVRVSTPKIPQSVRSIVDEDKPHRNGAAKAGQDSDTNNFLQELDRLMDQYDCLTGTIAYVQPLSNDVRIPIVVTAKTTKKTKSSTIANRGETSISTTSANTNANINVVTTAITTPPVKAGSSTSTSSSKAISNSATTASQTADTTANTDAETTEEATVTTDSISTQVTTQCGGVVVDNPNEAAKRLRNVVMNRMMRVIDYVYFQFENDLYVSRATGSFLGDAIDFGANFAATITNGERAKTIINAAIIAFRGGRRSASMHYFQEQTADVLITKMQTSRNRSLAGMLQQMKFNVDDYPLDAGLRDVIGYFYAGTLPRALQELKQDASIDAKAANDKILELKKISPTPAVDAEEQGISLSAYEALEQLGLELKGEPKQKENAVKQLKTIITALQADAGIKKLLEEQDLGDLSDGEKMRTAIINLKRNADDFGARDALVTIEQTIVRIYQEDQ